MIVHRDRDGIGVVSVVSVTKKYVTGKTLNAELSRIKEEVGLEVVALTIHHPLHIAHMIDLLFGHQSSVHSNRFYELAFLLENHHTGTYITTHGAEVVGIDQLETLFLVLGCKVGLFFLVRGNLKTAVLTKLLGAAYHIHFYYELHVGMSF